VPVTSLIFHADLLLRQLKTAVVKTYPISTPRFVCLRSCCEGSNSHSATRTNQNRHKRDVQAASVVKTFSANSLIDNERRSEKPSNPRRRARGGTREVVATDVHRRHAPTDPLAVVRPASCRLPAPASRSARPGPAYVPLRRCCRSGKLVYSYLRSGGPENWFFAVWNGLKRCQAGRLRSSLLARR
jgi:hypothetical protein